MSEQPRRPVEILGVPLRPRDEARLREIGGAAVNVARAIEGASAANAAEAARSVRTGAGAVLDLFEVLARKPGAAGETGPGWRERRRARAAKR